MKIICKVCGAENSDNETYCNNCGSLLDKPKEESLELEKVKCAKCGALISPNDRFCLKCGHKVGAPVETQPEEEHTNCEKCGAVMGVHDKFCLKCGHKIGTTIEETTPVIPVIEEVTEVIPVIPEEKIPEELSEPKETTYGPGGKNGQDQNRKIIIGVLAGLLLIALIILVILLGRGKPNETTQPVEPETVVYPDEESTPHPEITPEPTPEPTPETTPVPDYREGTVWISSNASPRRIKIRMSPSLSGADTGKRAYDGDRVKVYESTTADGYTWYRIGTNRWIADNGTSFGVIFD